MPRTWIPYRAYFFGQLPNLAIVDAGTFDGYTSRDGNRSLGTQSALIDFAGGEWEITPRDKIGRVAWGSFGLVTHGQGEERGGQESDDSTASGRATHLGGRCRRRGVGGHDR